MTSLIHSMTDEEQDKARNALFPHAPEGWTARRARTQGRAEGLTLTDEHWQVVRALQEYFARHEERERNMRELHDALDELFHASGGIRYLYALFPGGPVAQGCRVAGLHSSDIVTDQGFGSVM